MAETFRARVELHGKTATGIEVPADVIERLGQGRRPKVTVTIGSHTYRTTAAFMGGQFLVPLAADNRAAAGVEAGDDVDVLIAADESPREVPVPDDLATAIDAAPGAREFYDALSFTHRKEWVRWVEESKKPETRATRIEKTATALAEGRRTR